jgi:hypothetical protein
MSVVLLLLWTGETTAQDLLVTLLGNGEWVSRFDPLEFGMSRPVASGERVVLILGTTDVTSLCTIHGDTLTYHPSGVPLPAGSVTVSAYLVDVDGLWTPAGGGSLNVLTTAGLEKNHVTTSITLSSKGQLADEHFPDANTTGRGRFQELNGQMNLRVDVERSGVGLGFGINTVGASFRQEALRFGEKGEDAAKVDLAGYLMEIRTGRTILSVGHISHGRERHLLNGFPSRGISATTALGTFADISGAILNGTSIVGWDNMLGLQNPNHRIYTGTLGMEVLPHDPGTIRIEASYVHGSQLPFSNFNRAQINDAEQSDGGSVRVLASDPGRNITVDAGVARTRFINPADPLLSQRSDIVPVEATTRQARYADVAWDVIRNATILDGLPARLSVAFRHERVDPLYRAVGANTRSDNLQNTYELHAGAGPLQTDVTHLESEDNLADVPSVLTSKTRQTNANVAFFPSGAAGLLAQWLPSLSYSFQSTHQFGVRVPTNSDFTPDRVPDQVSTSHTAAIDWQGSAVKFGYRATLTTQDNRQPGRENADVVNRTNSISISFVPVVQVSMNLEGMLESTENTGTGALIRNERVGANILAAIFGGAQASLNASLSATAPENGSSSQRQESLSLETSYGFDLSSSFRFVWRGQVFLRYSWSEVTSRDNVFNVNTQTRAWVVNTGISFNLF